MRPPSAIVGDLRYVTTSVGIGIASGPNENADSALKKADDALYRAKRAGRGGFRTENAAPSES